MSRSSFKQLHSVTENKVSILNLYHQASDLSSGLKWGKNIIAPCTLSHRRSNRSMASCILVG